MTAGPGDVLAGRYEISARLGSGGMAEVFLARDRVLERAVAVKVLAAHLLDDDNATARFRREARAVASLSHPNIVAVHDACVDGDGDRFLVMELVHGMTLADHIAERGPLPLDRVVDIAAGITDALDAAHRAGIVHRDVKPSNIMIDTRGGVKVADFGIARAAAAVTTQTLTGTIHGTAPYLSPEQAAGRPAGPRSDLYSLGCVLYEMLAGQPPFRGAAAGVVHQHLHRPPPPLSALRPDVTPALEAVVMKALSKSPSDRFATAADMGAALRGRDVPHAADASVSGPSAVRAVRGAAGRSVAAATLVALATTAAVVAGIGDQRGDRSPGREDGATAQATPRASAAEEDADSGPYDVAADLRELITEAQGRRNPGGEAAEELDRRLSEALEKLGDRRPDEARGMLREMRRELDRSAERGEVDAALAGRLRGGIAELERLVATPSPRPSPSPAATEPQDATEPPDAGVGADHGPG